MRFDLGTDCGAGYVDIVSVALPGTRDSYLVFADHLSPGGPWGQAMLGPTDASSMYAMVYMRGARRRR